MKNLLFIAALSGALAVALGAFGAHGLKPYLDGYQTDIYNKAVLYQFVHTLAIFFVANTANNAWGKRAASAFLIGILLFSGSLYLLATAHLHGLPKMILGPITPLGGLSFIAGWLMLAVGALQSNNNNK